MAFVVGVASVVFASLALAGLLIVFAQIPSLYPALKIIGGAYLCYLSWRFWQAAAQHHESASAQSVRSTSPIRCLSLGFATQASNPKAAVVYASTLRRFCRLIQTSG